MKTVGVGEVAAVVPDVVGEGGLALVGGHVDAPGLFLLASGEDFPTIFEPLKEIMRDIQRTGTESGMDYGRKLDISAYRMHLEDLQERSGMEKKNENYNICPSTPETDGKLWKESLKRPVMLGIISAEDGKRLLRFFPDGIVTVLENVTMRCDAEMQAVHLQQGTISRPKNSAAQPIPS